MLPPLCYRPPANAQEATEQEWANAYQQYYQECRQADAGARSAAAEALGSMCEQVASRAGMDRGRHQHGRSRLSRPGLRRDLPDCYLIYRT
jgi:hypothetical protein